MTAYLLYACIPVLGAFIGWLTNFVAIYMIFHPRNRISILGIPIHGLLPRRQEEMALQISETIEEEFLSSRDIARVMQSLDFEKDIEQFIDRVIDERFSDLIEGIPLMGSFVTDNIMKKVKKVFNDEIKEYKNNMISDIAEQVGHSIDVREMVYERISDFDIDRLERIVKRIAGKELAHIKILGGVLGFVIGCIQVAVVIFAGGLSI